MFFRKSYESLCQDLYLYTGVDAFCPNFRIVHIRLFVAPNVPIALHNDVV